ncbi:hypothetical protein CANARDRAFT_28728 [[Candida] arabinofermentans NRRL YB-2248]|uniref:Aspartate aminotransferase n=1 Tax=[Candida] arabinofermentans NRRL YB-2248 TaxID=983967 RepID=A0A1E4SZS5_9ASCO|nr:hypothetical protein CANARDRAFT_28728 [[Candida] arabinofermentans NRRL YB-2248]
MSRSFKLQNIPQLPPDPLFGLKARFTADNRSDKVDLGIGAYRDNNGKPWILPSVKLAENLIQNSNDYNHEYLPISGYESFTKSAAKVILGDNSRAINENRLISIQSLSGTGALHIVAKFLKDFYLLNDGTGEPPIIYLSKPTWANHIQIFEYMGLKVEFYPYWNNETKSLDLNGFLKSIELAPSGSVFLLHSTAHNPTGLDPKQDEWLKILNHLQKYNHLPLFDSAYQGFSSGSLSKDAWAVRTAVDDLQNLYTFPIIICQSFAKNVGMYGERVGAVHIILPRDTLPLPDLKLNNAILSQLSKIIRSELSNPPAYGAKIVSKILNTPQLFKQWEDDLITMSSRIMKMRKLLVDELILLKTPGDWSHIIEQQGMFSFTGLNVNQVKRLELQHGVYLVGSGRASIAGLNESNIKKVAKCIDEVVRFEY